jgi:hypothetical protein
MSPFRKKFGGLDRGRGMMGAKHSWVTDDLAMFDVKPAARADHFQSRREAKRWIALKQEEKFGGFIRNLRRQVRFPLHATRPDGLKEKIGAYVADFVYERKTAPLTLYGARLVVGETLGNDFLGVSIGAPPVEETWVEIIEDSKGMKTDLYTWKRAHFLIEYYPATIVEV